MLDTSTVILLGRLDPSELSEEPTITAITLAERSVSPLVATEHRVRAARQAHLQQSEADFDPCLRRVLAVISGESIPRLSCENAF